MRAEARWSSTNGGGEHCLRLAGSSVRPASRAATSWVSIINISDLPMKIFQSLLLKIFQFISEKVWRAGSGPAGGQRTPASPGRPTCDRSSAWLPARTSQDHRFSPDTTQDCRDTPAGSHRTFSQLFSRSKDEEYLVGYHCDYGIVHL